MNDQQKPWGDDTEFDAEKAWTLIQNLRGDNERLKSSAATVAEERDSALAEVKAHAGKVEELQATVQLTDDSVKAKEQEYASLNVLRSKENLLIDAGLPRKYAAQVIGDDEAAWNDSVNALAELRGAGSQERRPDPAQVAEPAEPSDDAQAKQFFGI